jgi:hypothetical protein
MEKIIISPIQGMAAYSCDAYGQNAYSTCGTTGTSGNTTSPSGFLAATGYPVLIPVALGLALVIAAVILLVKQWMRRRATRNVVSSPKE